MLRDERSYSNVLGITPTLDLGNKVGTVTVERQHLSKKLTQQKVFKLFAKPKQLLRKSDVRALEALVEAMGAALDPITIRDV